MIRNAMIAGAALATVLFVQPACAANVGGFWVGTNTASQLPGQKIPVALVLNQTGANVAGGYVAASGVYGTGTGSFSGDTGTMTWTNASQCQGTYTNSYKIVGPLLTWTYSGQDCLGPETGEGVARRQMIGKSAHK